MQRQQSAEIHALDRVLYLLEERSVAAAVEHNDDARQFMEAIYDSVNDRATALRARSMVS